LPVTVQDAQALHKALSDPMRCAYPDGGDHIQVLYDANATRDAILQGVEWLADQVAADGDATAILFYSGHGWCDQAGAYYLIPHDADPLDIPSSAISASAFTNVLRSVQARRLLVILDCCHAAGMATAKDGQRTIKLPLGLVPSAPPKEMLDGLKQGEGRAIFTSSRSEQVSWIRPDGRLSLYTHHLLEALQGAGSRPGDTVVRLSALMAHLGQAVPASARMLGHVQTPFFDTSTEDFAVALLIGGKGHDSGVSEQLVSPATGSAVTQTIINNAPNQGAQGIFHGPLTFQIGGAPTPNAIQSVAKGLDQDELIAEQKKLLSAHRRTLSVLLAQQAKLGSAWTPPGTIGGTVDARTAIKHIKQFLRDLGQPVPDHPNDEPGVDEAI